MLVMCPFFDDISALYSYKYSNPCIIRILVSCVFALGVNVSNYLVLGKTSPLTYQVSNVAVTLFMSVIVTGLVFIGVRSPQDHSHPRAGIYGIQQTGRLPQRYRHRHRDGRSGRLYRGAKTRVHASRLTNPLHSKR